MHNETCIIRGLFLGRECPRAGYRVGAVTSRGLRLFHCNSSALSQRELCKRENRAEREGVRAGEPCGRTKKKKPNCSSPSTLRRLPHPQIGTLDTNFISQRVMGDPSALQTAWKAGVWHRLPLSGLLALIAALVATAAMVAVIAASDGMPIDSWRFQSTVYLSISYTVANIALRFTLSEAVRIAWWAKAVGGDVKVRDLHNIWSFGDSLLQSLGAGRAFNLIALGSLVVSLVSINGPILQQASAIEEINWCK